MPVHALQDKVAAFARRLEPKRVIGFDKIRLGRDFDGGYVLLDDFSDVEMALSLGIADDASWDLAIAQRGIPVHQFDPTIDRSPIDHPLMTFHKQGIAASDVPGAVSLDTLASELLSGCQKALLKIDVEGHEWPLFAAASPATLSKFAQITCEFHGFNRLADAAWYDSASVAIAKMKSIFDVVHVHGNNAMPFANVANVILPILLEITFANRNHYQMAETNEIFPTALDQPNLPQIPDMYLGCFKF